MLKLAKVADHPVCFQTSKRDTDSTKTEQDAKNKREPDHRFGWFLARKSFTWLERVVYQVKNSRWVTKSEHARRENESFGHALRHELQFHEHPDLGKAKPRGAFSGHSWSF